MVVRAIILAAQSMKTTISGVGVKNVGRCDAFEIPGGNQSDNL
jgi:hypothetical protein